MNIIDHGIDNEPLLSWLRIMLYETKRKFDRVGSSAPACCRVFPATNASAGNRRSCRRHVDQRQTLETGVENTWRGRSSCQAASWPGVETFRTTKTGTHRDSACGSCRRGISHRPVDKRVAKVIRKRFKVSYHPDHVRRILHDLGFTPQKPRRVAREQDAAAVERWRKQDWPRIKKKQGDVAPALFLSMKRVFDSSQ